MSSKGAYLEAMADLCEGRTLYEGHPLVVVGRYVEVLERDIEVRDLLLRQFHAAGESRKALGCNCMLTRFSDEVRLSDEPT